MLLHSLNFAYNSIPTICGLPLSHLDPYLDTLSLLCLYFPPYLAAPRFILRFALILQDHFRISEHKA